MTGTHRITRREFCAAAAGGALSAGLCGAVPPLLAAEGAKARVVVARDDAFWVSGAEPDTGKIAKALDEGLRKLTGKGSAVDAWKHLFKPDDRVLVKLNCLAGRHLSTRPELAEAVCGGIRKAGVPWKQIMLWERRASELRAAGFAPRAGDGQPQIAGTDQLSYGVRGYEREPEFAGDVGSCFAVLLTRWATAVVNLPILKDHNLAGFSGGMKNFYGAIHNPNKYHDNNCDPYIADLNTSPHIKGKLRLVVCDALRAQYENGPAYSPAYAWQYKGFLMSLDPVAIDAIGAGIIEDARRRHGLDSLAKAGRPPKWLQTAARRGLGEADLARIERVAL